MYVCRWVCACSLNHTNKTKTKNTSFGNFIFLFVYLMFYWYESFSPLFDPCRAVESQKLYKGCRILAYEARGQYKIDKIPVIKIAKNSINKWEEKFCIINNRQRVFQ